MKKWLVYEERENVHVSPTGDTHKHMLRGLGCPCDPDIEWGERNVVIHNSWDKREEREPGMIESLRPADDEERTTTWY